MKKPKGKTPEDWRGEILEALGYIEKRLREHATGQTEFTQLHALAASVALTILIDEIAEEFFP